MAIEPNQSPNDDAAWDARLRYWRRELGRLRLGVEPIEEQLARYRRVTLMLTAVPIGIATMFFGLFTAFGRPDVGLVVVLILLAPIVAVAWIDDARLRRRAARYLRELKQHQARAKTSGGA